MATGLRWTSADLTVLPDDGKLYEIVDGELYVSTQPHAYHQYVCLRIGRFLDEWNDQTGAGMAIPAPGLLFGESEDVAPDLVWISSERLATALEPDGKFHSAPELVIEVLSPGSANERRDREVKLKLYSRRGVHEYWIVDWRQRQVEVYRREQAALHLVETLYEQDALRSPLLPGFTHRVAELFGTIRPDEGAGLTRNT
jgi:Uma2 family endonuclease